MKKLPYLILSFVLCLSSYSCADSEDTSEATADKTASASAETAKEEEETIIFAINSGGSITFVVDTNVLLMDWQTYLTSLAEVGPCQLNQVDIILLEEKYYMIATGTKGSNMLKSTVPLEVNETGDLFITGLTISCTTDACSSESEGCVPNVTSCSPCANKGKCTKNITMTPKIMFPNL